MLHEFLSTVTALYYREASAFAAQSRVQTREEIPLQLHFDNRDHSGKTDGALQDFALELRVWKKVDDDVLVVVENMNVRGYSCAP